MKKMNFEPFVPGWIDGADKEILKGIADKVKEEAKPGYWIEENRRANSSKFICSKCGLIANFIQCTRNRKWTKHCPYQFCPHCGSPMNNFQIQKIWQKGE